MDASLGRRQYSRASVHWPVTLLTSQDKSEGATENVSPTGVFIFCKDLPPLEGNIRMVIKVPGHQPMNVVGKVVWSKIFSPNKGAPFFGVGIQFTQISENDSNFLRDVILKRYGSMINRVVETSSSGH